MKKTDITVEQIADCLPRTQCTLCDYPGCKPYATAILNGETDISHCHPGGEKTLDALASLLEIDPEPYRPKVKAQYETPQVAVIDKDVCIGCTKCLPPCPVDAIIGMRKQMHTVIAEVCTGCGLCVEPCPMDCITMADASVPKPEPWSDEEAQLNKMRYRKHKKRLKEREKTKFAPIRK